jgi:hypothetical protein
MLKVLSWNMASRPELWRSLMSADVDVALLQEACAPPADVAAAVRTGPEEWRTDGEQAVRSWRAGVVGLKAGIDIRWYTTRPIRDAGPDELAVSRVGSLAAAEVTDPDTGEVFTLVSLYSCWERPHESTGSSWIYADASAHRLISDLSTLIGSQRRHRIVAAGDLNILKGYGEHGSQYWARRYQTVFDRFDAMGMAFVGPQSPNGRQADPWPEELPEESCNVPTYFTAQQTVENPTRQLDFVFASAQIADRISVRALNHAHDWGGSDHCRIEIEIAD